MWSKELEYNQATKLTRQLYETTSNARTMDSSDITMFENNILDCINRLTPTTSTHEYAYSIVNSASEDQWTLPREGRITPYEEYQRAISTIERIYQSEDSTDLVPVLMMHLRKISKKNRLIMEQLQAFADFEDEYEYDE